MILKMPGHSYQGVLPNLTELEQELLMSLQNHVNYLSSEIGERNMNHYLHLQQAADYIQMNLSKSKLHIMKQIYQVRKKPVANIIATIPGTTNAHQIVVVGAHYDSVKTSPGATDNATGVAAILELAKLLSLQLHHRSIRLASFVNEEPPYFKTPDMGSLVYAKYCRRQKDQIVAMISLDSLGYFSEQKNSQHYPLFLRFFYPHTANFIGFVSNLKNRKLLADAIKIFRDETLFPSEGLASLSIVPGVDWSDHWAFWQQNYPAIMVTDTAPLRNPYYHTSYDLPEIVNFDHLARVTTGLVAVISYLANTELFSH